MAAAAPDMSGVSEYELQRLAHIKRNQECLERLGLADLSWAKMLGASAEEKKKPRAPRPKREPVVVQCRRSRRAKGTRPEYAGVDYSEADRHEAMDSDEEGGGWGAALLGDSAGLSIGDDIESLSPVGKPRNADADKEAQYAAIIADSKAWLAASRAALCSVDRVGATASGAIQDAASDADEWRAEAVRRWGARVNDVAGCSDWEEYVKSRISRPPPPSPLELLQELYAHGARRLSPPAPLHCQALDLFVDLT